MNSCSEFQEELASCAAQGQEPVQAVALHLLHCARCRDAWAILRPSAELQAYAANHLPEPQMRPALRSRFLHMQTAQEPIAPRLSAVIWARSAATGLTVLCVVLLSFWWKSYQPLVERKLVRFEPRADEVEPTYREPAWQALRQEVNADNLLSDSRPGGGAMASYRLRDAHLDRD